MNKMIEKKLEAFDKSDYKNIISAAVDLLDDSLSDESFQRAVLFSACFYYDVFIEKMPRYRVLKKYMMEYPVVFSLFDVPDNSLASKELIFVKTALEGITEEIVSKQTKTYSKLRFFEGITVFSFAQWYENKETLWNWKSRFMVSKGYTILNKLRKKIGSHEVSSLSLFMIGENGDEKAAVNWTTLDVLEKAEKDTEFGWVYDN